MVFREGGGVVDIASSPPPPASRSVEGRHGPFISLTPFAESDEYELCRAVESYADGTRLECVVQFLRSKDPRVHAQFIADARRAVQIDHPNVVAVRRADSLKGRPYLVREYVNGANVRALVESANYLSPGLIAEFGSVVCTALDHLHSTYGRGRNPHCDRAHGAVRPTNIIISRTGQLKLTELAIGRPRRTPSMHDVRQRFPSFYIAPERLAGRSGGPEADAFSLGVVLIELLLAERLPRILQTPPGASAEACEAFARMWQKRRPNVPERMRRLLLEMTALRAHLRPKIPEAESRLAAIAERAGRREPLDSALRNLLRRAAPNGDIAPKPRSEGEVDEPPPSEFITVDGADARPRSRRARRPVSTNIRKRPSLPSVSIDDSLDAEEVTSPSGVLPLPLEPEEAASEEPTARIDTAGIDFSAPAEPLLYENVTADAADPATTSFPNPDDEAALIASFDASFSAEPELVALEAPMAEKPGDAGDVDTDEGLPAIRDPASVPDTPGVSIGIGPEVAEAPGPVEPVRPEHEPVEARAEPVEAREEPVEARAEPVEAREEPVEARDEPVEAPSEQIEPEEAGANSRGLVETGDHDEEDGDDVTAKALPTLPDDDASEPTAEAPNVAKTKAQTSEDVATEAVLTRPPPPPAPDAEDLAASEAVMPAAERDFSDIPLAHPVHPIVPKKPKRRSNPPSPTTKKGGKSESFEEELREHTEVVRSVTGERQLKLQAFLIAGLGALLIVGLLYVFAS